jgi:hypothetical protein
MSHDNWDYPNGEFSKHFMTISGIHTASHICFQTIVLYRCNFANGYDINTPWMSS